MRSGRRAGGGNVTRAAEEVGMYRQTFQQKMRELGIAVENVKNREPCT